MPEKQVLGLKPAPRLEQVGERRSKHALILPHRANPSGRDFRERQASDSVIHPRSPAGKALSDADNASSSTALSLRASGGTEVPRPKAALIVFHIPMPEPLYCSTVNHHSLDPQRCRAR